MNNENINDAITRGDIKLYALGGAGITIGATMFENHRHHQEPGMADIDTSYIDTSTANVQRVNIPKDKVFIVPGAEKKDGSGKERKRNAALISKHIKEIVQAHPPGYLNIVLSSASGGTGAVAAAILTNELMQQDQMVINITIGVVGSGTEIENTLDTLQSFEGLVKAHKRSVPVAYFENSLGKPMSDVDNEVAELITAISVLFSRQNEGLDTRDMYNFLNVEKLTNYKPHAIGLVSYAGKLIEKDHKDTISLASAVITKDNLGIDFVLPYTTYGILPAEITSEISAQAPVHLATKAYPFNDISARLKEMIQNMEDAAKASTAQSEVLDGNEELEFGFLKM